MLLHLITADCLPQLTCFIVSGLSATGKIWSELCFAIFVHRDVLGTWCVYAKGYMFVVCFKMDRILLNGWCRQCPWWFDGCGSRRNLLVLRRTFLNVASSGILLITGPQLHLHHHVLLVSQNKNLVRIVYVLPRDWTVGWCLFRCEVIELAWDGVWLCHRAVLGHIFVKIVVFDTYYVFWRLVEFV